MFLADKKTTESHPSAFGEGPGLPAGQAGVRWYIAKVIFNIVRGITAKNSQFEEQLRLVEAESTEEAYLKARAIGIGEEEIIMQREGQLIKWEFVDVAELLPLQSFQNGLEIYSQIHETEESRQYIHNVHQRGMNLRMNVQLTNA